MPFAVQPTAVEGGGVTSSSDLSDASNIPLLDIVNAFTKAMSILGDLTVDGNISITGKLYDEFVTAGISIGETGQATLDSSFIRGSILGALNELKFSKIVKVSSLADFPTPISGVIHLEYNTLYILDADVNIGTNVIKANTTSGSVNVIRSSNTSGNILAYDGTEAMFTDSELTTSLFLNEVKFSTPNGKVSNIRDTTLSGTGTILFFTCQFLLCTELGSIEDVRFIEFFSQQILCGPGWKYNNCNSITYNFNNNLFGLNSANTTFVEIDGDNGPVAINGNFFATASNETIFDIKPTSTTSGGIISMNQFDDSAGGSLLVTGSKDHKDVDWLWGLNQGAKSQQSSVTAVGTIENNLDTTSIPVTDAWVIVNVTTLPPYWVNRLLERGTLSADGTYTYEGVNNKTLDVRAGLSLEPLSPAKRLSATLLNTHAHDSFTVTFTNGTNLVNETGTTLTNGVTISFKNTTGTLPTGLRPDIVYFVVNKTTNAFQVSYTLGGPVVSFSTDGTPINNYSVSELTGKKATNYIANGSERDLDPYSLILVETGDQVNVVVSCKDAVVVDIDVLSGYFQVAAIN